VHLQHDIDKEVCLHPRSVTPHDEDGSFVAADATAKMEDKLLTPAGSYMDEPFQRAENSCLPQYPKLLLDVYERILKNITDSGLRLPPYWDSVFDGTGETRMPFGPCMLDDDASHDGDFWLSDAAISYPGPYGVKRCAVCRLNIFPAKRKDIHYYLFYYNRGMRTT